MDEQVHCVRQATITLPFFDYEVPVLYVEDGTRYIPVIALCEMLGLRANAYIPRWRKLVLWASARKLPLSTSRGKRLVWCLHLGALPFWCVCFEWSSVSTERRMQLHQATDVWLEDIAQVHQQMLDDYRSLRKGSVRISRRIQRCGGQAQAMANTPVPHSRRSSHPSNSRCSSHKGA